MVVATGCGDGSDGGASSDVPSLSGRVACDVTFGVTDDVGFATLDALVDYHRAPGGFVGEDAGVQCTRLISQTQTITRNHCDSEAGCLAGRRRTLLISVVRGYANIDGPVGLTRCRYEGDDAPRPDELKTISAHATAAGGLPVKLTVRATAIDCRATGPGSTTSTTSTTLPACEDLECPPGELCVRGECVPSGRYELEFSLTDAVEIGALQVEVAYDCASGSVVGEDELTECLPEPTLNAFASFNDRTPDDGSCTPVGEQHESFDQLGVAFVSAPGVTGPTRLFTCTFQSRGPSPAPQDFAVRVIDASTPALVPISPSPTVVVSEVRELVP
jgi:hypothetical protein